MIETDAVGKVAKRRAWCVSQGGSAFVYVLDEGKKNELIRQLRGEPSKVEGVRSVLGPEEFVKLGLPHPDDNPEMAHLVLTTGPGYSFGDALTGKDVIGAGGLKGTHGHLSQPAFMHATFLAAGAGIKRDVRLKIVQSIDVAPTIGHLLGVRLPTAEGQVLRQILAD